MLFGLAVVVAAIGVASARAGDTGTTTTETTTTGTTTTTSAPSYARLAPSYLPTSCVGAGAALIEEPGRPPWALGTPASSLGPSAYPAATPLVAFGSLAASGATCSSTSVKLASVSLFGGAITASSVSGTAGRGTVTGLQVEGADESLGPGQLVAVGNWAQLTVERKVGRARAILVVTLLAQHSSLPAGTVIAVGFEAAPQPAAKPKPATQQSHPQADGQAPPTVSHTGPTAKPSQTNAHATKKHQRLQHQKPPPDYPRAPSPLKVGGGFTDAVQDNPVIATALQYLGVPYQWGGTSPKTGFDCSGLVQYVFAKLGVPLVHYAAAQYRTPYGVWVPPDRLQTGDLVFFVGSDGTRKEPGHVGIYIDDGYIIDAPHTGTLVRIDNLNEPKLANQYVGARRIDTNLIDARHLLHAAKPAAPVTAVPVGFQQLNALASLGEPVGTLTADVAGARTADRVWSWTGGTLGGLLLLLVPGGLLVRRRLRSDASPSPETLT
jgi:cell wall-associated NlpC family hydrolase